MVTLTIDGTCDGGNHVFLTLTKNGVQKQLVLETKDIFADTEDEVLKALQQKAKETNARRIADLPSSFTL